MTDWERIEKLRARGKTWSQVAADARVGFHPPDKCDPGRALKALYLRRGHAGKVAPPAATTPSIRSTSRRPRRTQWIVLAALVGVTIIVAVYASELQSSNGKPTGWVGRIAPDFSLPIANGGGTFHLDSERNQTNVLLFFNEGLGCSGCYQQMEQLDSNAGEFQAIHVLIVSITETSLSSLSAWAANNNITHTLVLSDPTLTVCNEYDTTGAAVSMMPGSAPGHTFILVNKTGIVLWRADYGPDDMSVPDATILQAVQAALQ